MPDTLTRTYTLTIQNKTGKTSFFEQSIRKKTVKHKIYDIKKLQATRTLLMRAPPTEGTRG